MRVGASLASDGLPTPRRYWAMVAIALGITMSVLDAAVANIALPTIARQLHASPAATIWVVNAYQIANVVALLPLAALGERIGFRQVYLAGLVVFTLGSLACALSQDLPVLVAARILQGFGAAGIMAVNGALVRYTYPLRLLGRGVGLNALVVSIAAAIGPTVASGILAVASWEWLFAVNVPIGLVNFVVAARALPTSDRSANRFDGLSASLNAVAFGLLFVGVDALTRGDGDPWAGLMELAIAALAAIVLVRRESRSALPLIPVDLMRNPLFALSVATSVCSFVAYMLAFLALPFYIETVLHRDAVATGLLMTPWPVALGIAAPIAGRLADRVSAAILGSAGLGILTLGLLSLAIMPIQVSPVGIAWRMALCGFGFGFFQAPNNRTLLASAPRNRAGAAGGMLATARLFGMSGGATLAAIVFRAVGTSTKTIDMLIAAAFALCGVIASLMRLSTSKRG